ncbi:M48 family metalloprotease [Pantanalinema sp. GBBB05]|uniref:M48 family metalloprotease n=1 Tax=Pantanalinema sp. GBBB05 TaxID=2604139 RepID=UPI001D9AA96B|nr:M48 family metalloprotease [Pantanalinema sp. GBBB05]
MPPFPESSSPETDADQTATLEAGLAAYKQGDYATAIHLLETGLAATAEHPLAIQAQMGLVVAYTRSGRFTEATDLCQSLQTSPHPKLREWVATTLSKLRKRQANTPADLADVTIATYTPRSPQPPLKQDNPTSHSKQTGFVPFDPSTAPPPPSAEVSADLTGFVPLETAPPVDAGMPIDEAPTQTSFPSTDRPITQSTPARSPASRQPVVDRRQAVEPEVSPDSIEAPPSLYQPVWRQAGRAQLAKSLGKIKTWRLVLVQVTTAISLFFVLQQSIYWVTTGWAIVLTKIPRLYFQREMSEPAVWPIVILLVVLFVGSRWLLDALLTALYGLRPLSLSQLGTYSPETSASLFRFCRKRNLPLPALGILPAQEPIVFSYGCLPWATRIVVSQGLLEQLSDDEIATIYAGELGHLAYWTAPLMSLITTLIQLPYTLYRLLVEAGHHSQISIIRGMAGFAAGISYGVYWCLRWLGLWLSRRRVYYSDRLAAELTGNPNGYVRALLKLAIGTSKAIQQQKQTSYLLEGFELLSPLSYQMALPLGSLYPYVRLEAIMQWDRLNPFATWLAMSQAHPPTGDRLYLLTLYARHWGLEPELDWGKEALTKQKSTVLSSQQWRTLLLQGAPFFGALFGLMIAVVLWLIGWIGDRLSISEVSWLYSDQATLIGLTLIGFGLGSFIRVNRLFPDLPPPTLRSSAPSPSLVSLLTQPQTLPITQLPVRLEGKLLGRQSNLSNGASQDLMLQTPTGLVKLHCTPVWGPAGNLLAQPIRPSDLIPQDVVVTGWFRRGVTPWIDVDTLRTVGGRVSRNYHPVWSSILGGLTCFLGIYLILRGGSL